MVVMVIAASTTKPSRTITHLSFLSGDANYGYIEPSGTSWIALWMAGGERIAIGQTSAALLAILIIPVPIPLVADASATACRKKIKTNRLQSYTQRCLGETGLNAGLGRLSCCNAELQAAGLGYGQARALEAQDVV